MAVGAGLQRAGNHPGGVVRGYSCHNAIKKGDFAE